jgi:hypothetical protein
LKEKRSKHESDGNVIFVLVLFRFASFCFQVTPTANRRHHTRNLVQGQLDVDETPIMTLPDTANTVWTLSKQQTTFHQEDPTIPDTVVWVRQLVVNAAQY